MAGGSTALTVEDAHHLAVLRSNCVAGLVTLSEFARSAKTLVAGGPATWSVSTTWSDLGVARRWMVNALRSARHRVVGLTPPRITVVSLLGASHVELDEARLLGDDLQVTAVAVFGVVEVLVPAGLAIDMSGARRAVDASVDATDADVDDTPLPGAPRIRVRGVPVFGRVKVRQTAKP